MKNYPSIKKCPHCQTEKPLTEFYIRRGNRPASYCKKCIKDIDQKKREARRALNGPKVRGPVSAETKKKISDAKKKWCRENPDKHPWRKNDKFKSVPCEKLKEYLRSKEIQFAEEFQPNVEGRSFSIDIAFPDKRIAIEVNGNQHYNPDGTLKSYYQERHDLLERNGWLVYELHFAMCYHLEKFETMLATVLSSEKKCEFDYGFYVPKKKEKRFCECGKEITKVSTRCMSCASKQRPSRRKSVLTGKNGKIAQKEELERMVMEMPMTQIGKEFGVSDNAIRKWCKRFGIETHYSSGYWAKKAKVIRICECGNVIESRHRKKCPKCTKSPVRPIISREALEESKLG